MAAKTIFVAGTRRKAGKTLVTAFLLRSLPGAGAIKVTCCRSAGGCPRGRPCGVCQSLSGPFEVVQDHDILAQPGKDTARLLKAASGKVVWLKSLPDALAPGLRAALALFADEKVVIVEGNAAFQLARRRFIRAAVPASTSSRPRDTIADLGLLVIGPGPEPSKPSVNVALPFIRGVVLNTRPGFPPPVMMEGLPSDVSVFSFDAANPEDDPRAHQFAQWVADRLGI
jgi:hypothetical protein